MLKEKDYGPLLTCALLVLLGTPFAVWLMANPEAIELARVWIDTNDVLWKIAVFLAIQPAMLAFWVWLNRRHNQAGTR